MEPGDLLGRPIDQVLGGGLEELADIIAPVAQGAEPVSRGEVMVKRLGREIPLGLNVNHMTTSKGAIVGAIAIFTDLTREKEMTARIREADRLAAVGELAASIAHEIRNPLASLRGSVEMLQDELQLEDYQEQLFALVLKESGACQHHHQRLPVLFPHASGPDQALQRQPVHGGIPAADAAAHHHQGRPGWPCAAR